jgi:hypothetical protein
LSSLGVSKGISVGMGRQVASCKMGSLVNFIISRIFNESVYCILGVETIGIYGWELVPFEEDPLIIFLAKPNKVDLRKYDPSNVVFMGECKV